MWKSVGQVELCAGCSIICVVELLVCRKVLWIVVAAAARWCECWKSWGGGKKKHSVLDVDVPRPKCISNPNLPKWWFISSIPFSRSPLLPNRNAPSSMYRHCRISYAISFVDLNMVGVWLQIFPLIRLSSLAVITLRMGISCCLQTVLRVSANAVMRKKNRTGAMLSPWHMPTLRGISTISFSILSMQCCQCRLFGLRQQFFWGAPLRSRMRSSRVWLAVLYALTRSTKPTYVARLWFHCVLRSAFKVNRPFLQPSSGVHCSYCVTLHLFCFGGPGVNASSQGWLNTNRWLLWQGKTLSIARAPMC